MSDPGQARSEHGRSDLVVRYASIVRSYLAGDRIAALDDAYRFGTEAREHGIDPAALFAIHREVVDEMTVRPEVSEFPTDVETVFAEMLVSFQSGSTIDELSTALAELLALIQRQGATLAAVGRQLEDPVRTKAELDALRSMIPGELTDLYSLAAELARLQERVDARRLK